MARSFCFSRLLFNVHVWSSLSPWAVRRLNGCYMRVLRRVAGQPKYKAGQWTDEKVRVCLYMPEIMCYISQNRLCYLAHLAKGRADTLLRLVNVSFQLPWVILVKHRHHMFQSLGHPIDNAMVWADYITRFPHQWKRQVRSWIHTSSVLDGSATKGGCKRKTQNEYVFKCGTCGVCFEGDRALRCHEQVTHKKRTPVKHWVPVNGTCCVCGVKFSTKLRLIAHLSDRRQEEGKPPCRASLGRYDAIDSCEVVRMDELDRQARRKARRVGQSQPRSAGLWTRGPSVIKRIGPRNGGFLLSSLYLCRLTFCAIEDALAFLVMLCVCCCFFRFFWRAGSCPALNVTLSTLRVISGKNILSKFASSFCCV